MATKNSVKKLKQKLTKLSKKYVLTDGAQAAMKKVDELLKAGDFDGATAACTAAEEVVEKCDRKTGGKKKGGDGGGAGAGAGAGGGGSGGGTKDAKKAKPTEPLVEVPVVDNTVEAVAARGVAKGLSGLELVKYALEHVGAGAGAALIQAEEACKHKACAVGTGYRTFNCEQLRTSDIGKEVALTGWVQAARAVGQMLGFVLLRDRYGKTQCVFANEEGNATAQALFDKFAEMRREWCIRVVGTVRGRDEKDFTNAYPSGFVEVLVTDVEVLTKSKTPPFLIEDDAKCAEDLRLTYRYLDIRRDPIKNGLLLRNRVTQLTRNYLNGLQFVEVETPVLIKSTPEGARDFIVPSRLNAGQWYALPQSPQTFKQILMVSGIDRYFQIAKCFRDEDLRPDRQLEFTQIDCEMSFVKQEDVLQTFEGLVRLLFEQIQGHTFPPLQKMQYHDAMRDYGIDKPDLRFGMLLHDLTELTHGHNSFFDEEELVLGIAVEGCANKTKKEVAAMQAVAQGYGAKGMATIKCTKDYPSSIKKFFTPEELERICKECEAKEGDLVCIFHGKKNDKFREVVGKFRHYVGDMLGLRSKGFHALWVVDFPLVEWNDEQNRYTAMHHPFTSCKEEDRHLMATDLAAVRANAYDLVINGVEVGGGSIRIHDKDLQHEIFKILGFTKEEAEEQFGFLLGAFEYGAPPHGGLAFGLDRLCTLLGGGSTDIRDFIAFPKNTAGRDMMIDAPYWISQDQMDELNVATTCEHKVITTKAQFD